MSSLSNRSNRSRRKLKTVTNWNGTSECHPSEVHFPSTIDEIQSIIRQTRHANKRLRIIGHRAHTWGLISMCDDGDVVVNLGHFNKVLSVDEKNRTITAQAGCSLEDMVATLEKEGLALLNMGEATEQTLGGVTATATHGSGGGPAPSLPDSFSDQVVSYKIVDLTDNAAVHTITREDNEVFDAFMVHLGLLGVVMEVTLQVRDEYYLKWNVRDIIDVSNLKLYQMKQTYDNVFSLTYTYFPSTNQVVEIVRDLTDNTHESGIESDIRDDFVSNLRQSNASLLKCCPCCVEPYANVQKRALLSLSGNSDQWGKVLPQGDLWGGAKVTWNYDVEYAFPFDMTLEALKVVRTILEEKTKKISTVVCIRFCRGSRGLMAPHFSTDRGDIFSYITVQFSTKQLDPRIPRILQNELSKLGGRAHWGKANSTTFDQISSYRLWPASNLNTFLDVKSQYDPDNLLGNSYTDRIFSQGEPGVITLVENGEAHTIRAIDGTEQEPNPIAIMALPGHATHKSGRIIPVHDGKVTRAIDEVAEC